MKNLFLILILISTFYNLSAQYIYKIELEIKDSIMKPIPYNKDVFIYNGEKQISWSNSKIDGKVKFIISKTDAITDSMYLLVGNNSISKGQKYIYLNELSLFKNNYIENLNIRIISYTLFTQEEFDIYTKKNKLIPRRRKIQL